MSNPEFMLLGSGGQLGHEWTRFLDRENKTYRSYNSSQLDITDSAALRTAIGELKPSVIVNCAAYSYVDRAEEEPGKAHLVNSDAVEVMSLAAKKAGSLLIHYSTDYVFSGRKSDMDKYPNGYSESEPLDPVNIYGRTKLDGETAIRKTNDRYLIVRLSWLNGAHGHNFVKTMLRVGVEKKNVKVVNDQIGSPTYAREAVFNSWNLIKREQTGLFHLTSHGVISWYDFAVEIFRQSGMNVRVTPVSSEEYQTVAPRPYYSKLCTDKISAVPGSRIIEWKEGLGNLIRELQG